MDTLLNGRWQHQPATHTHRGVASEVAKGTGWLLGPKPATAASVPFLLAKAGLSSPGRTGKSSTATYVLKQPLFFFLFTQEQSWVSIPDSALS